ncbi:MAG: S8 family serine peptidase [Acidimicrobiales bacterium]|nr:S8 family serine peptidase [Acidimicrobiales bacterium]
MRRFPALVACIGVVAALTLATPTPRATVTQTSNGERQVPSSRATTVDDFAGNRTPTGRQATATASEGLDQLGVPEWHAAGHTGTGITVAILDLGFGGLDDVPADDLPADLVEIAFDSDGIINRLTDHGTQMAEIVHDVAPDAELVAMTFTDEKFAEAVAWLEFAGVDVVSFSMEWTDGPLDGTHWTTAIIQASIDAGITWVVAAGNGADTHHNGTTMDVDDDGWIEVTSGGIEHNAFTIESGATAEVSLSWNDPATDLDLCLFDMELLAGDGQPTLIACTENPQGSGELATEILTLANYTGTQHRYSYGLARRSGPETTYEARTWGTGSLQFANPAASIAVPGNVADVITVGAVNWDTEVLQPYSAWGPNHMGDRKPEVVGPDQVTTSAWAGVENTGTSYAAPHVAGMVALILGAAPNLTPAGVKKRITDRASRANDPDYKHGWGVVRLGSLPSSITAIRGHWAETAIDWAFTTSITDRCPTLGDLTCPELAVTRDEMAGFLWRFRGLPAASSSAPFEDVPVDAPYGPAVDWLAEAEITLGCSATGFCPSGTVTRAEMAVFLWRLMGSPVGSPAAGFHDVGAGSFAKEAIDWLLDSGTTVGCTEVAFCPEDSATRAEMFTFLRRLDDAA